MKTFSMELILSEKSKSNFYKSNFSPNKLSSAFHSCFPIHMYACTHLYMYRCEHAYMCMGKHE